MAGLGSRKQIRKAEVQTGGALGSPVRDRTAGLSLRPIAESGTSILSLSPPVNNRIVDEINSEPLRVEITWTCPSQAQLHAVLSLRNHQTTRRKNMRRPRKSTQTTSHCSTHLPETTNFRPFLIEIPPFLFLNPYSTFLIK